MSRRDDSRRPTHPSAAATQRWTGVLAMLCIVCLACGLIAVMVRAPESARVWAVWAMLVRASLVLIAVGLWWVAVVRESKRGYTTMGGWLRHLKQRDPRTGKVVRPAGEPYPRRDGDGRS